jgi:sugar phosphate permease
MLAWRRGFYGYVIATTTFVVVLLQGSSYYSLSVIAPVMAGDLGWSAAAFGAAFSAFALVLGMASPLAGALILRFGARLAILAGSLLIATALALLSTTNTLGHLYAFSVVLGLGMSLGSLLPVQQLLGNWFVIRRSLILGLVLTGPGLGGLVITSLASGLVSATGSWQATWLVLAAVLLLPALLAVLFVRNSPGELGQEVDGIAPGPNLEANSTARWRSSRVFRTEHQWGTRAVIRTRTFWLVASASGVGFFLLQAVTAHQVAYLAGEAGMDLTVAASALGLITGFSVVGRLAAGWLGDRVEPRFVMAGMLLMMALSLLVLLEGEGIVSLYLYAILFGIGYGAMIVLTPAALLNYFGASSHAAIMGIATPVGTVFAAIGPLLVGFIRDMRGSYLPAFVPMMILAVVGALGVSFARPPAPVAAGSAEPIADQLP